MEKLREAVIRQLGIEDKAELKGLMEDINTHGADAGFPGFTYYYETVSFFEQNREEIAKYAEELANDLGVSTLQMIADFNCLKGDGYTLEEIAKVLYGVVTEDQAREATYSIIANALSWFALEEVSREEGETNDFI